MTLTRTTPPPGATRALAAGRLTTRRNRAKLPIALTLPAVVVLLAFFGYPIIQAVRISLSDWGGIGPIDFVGPEQYAEVLGGEAFYRSLALTFVYSIVSALGIVGVAALLATAVSHSVWGSRAYRVIWFIPAVVPGAAAAVFWATAFQPHIGTMNAVAKLVGLPGDSALLASPATAIYPLIFVTIWSGVGFAFLLLLGAMEQVPTSVYEAARIDGAGAARQFFSITLPLIRPVLTIVLILNVIGTFNNFAIVWGLTRGGPGDATTTLPVMVYKEAFLTGNYSTATAIAVISAIILLLLGLVMLKFSQSRQEN